MPTTHQSAKGKEHSMPLLASPKSPKSNGAKFDHVASPNDDSKIQSYSPIDGQLIGSVHGDTPESTRSKILSARKAQKAWWGIGHTRRAEILGRLPGVMQERIDEIAELVHKEIGKPRCEVIGLTMPPSAGVKFYSQLASKVFKEKSASSTFFIGAKSSIRYEPIGVVGCILPWNFPFELGMKNAIPALLAGNAYIHKPSEHCPLVGDLCRDLLLECGVPEDLYVNVHGGAEIGQTLIDNVDVVTFVGSPATGRKVAIRAAENLIPCVLELGGNDAAIVLEDADIPYTARGLINGTCFNAGQVCNGIERIFVHESIHDELVKELHRQLEELKQNTSGPVNDVGPVKWANQVRVYEAHTKDAIDKGATLHHGGKALKHASGSIFWEPTLLTGMHSDMTMMREETFGPFLPIQSFSAESEAISLANDTTPFGLGGSVWSKDKKRAARLALQLKAGNVMVNNALQSGGCITLPFGGAGESGLGRVQGREGFMNYVAPKALMIAPNDADVMWMPYSEKTEDLAKGIALLFYGTSIGKRIQGVRDFLKNK